MGVFCFKFGEDFDLFDGDWKLFWVVDFLMFEEFDGQFYVIYYFFIVFCGLIFDEFKVNFVDVLLDVYDMVLNGVEFGGGLVCIYNEDMQLVVFNIFGIDDEEVKNKFGFLLDVFCFGVLLYVGFVFGLDCLVMFMIGVIFICDVMVFFKIIMVVCLLMFVLSFVNLQQFEDLVIVMVKK